VEEPRGRKPDHFTDVQDVLDLELDPAAEEPAQAATAETQLPLDLSLGDIGELDCGGQQVGESQNLVFIHSAR
jgi:hypothetical protein